MTLRAGSYDKSEPDWKGIIRDDGWPVYECYHWGDNKHNTPDEARACARNAIAYIKANNKLPEGWTLKQMRPGMLRTTEVKHVAEAPCEAASGD